MPALKWTADEDSFLVTAVANRGLKWQRVAKDVWTKDAAQVDIHHPVFLKTTSFKTKCLTSPICVNGIVFTVLYLCSAVIYGSTFSTPRARKDLSTMKSRRFSCPAQGKSSMENGKTLQPDCQVVKMLSSFHVRLR